MTLSSKVLGKGWQIFLFTRPGCSLCIDAKSNCETVREKHKCDLKQIDIDAANHRTWRNVYDFDVPVVSPLLQPLSNSRLAVALIAEFPNADTRRKGLQ